MYKRQVGVGEDRLRERGSLPATFYVLTRVIFYMTNDNCRKFKQNQMMFCIQNCIVAVSYTHLDVYKRQSTQIIRESFCTFVYNVSLGDGNCSVTEFC